MTGWTWSGLTRWLTSRRGHSTVWIGLRSWRNLSAQTFRCHQPTDPNVGRRSRRASVKRYRVSIVRLLKVGAYTGVPKICLVRTWTKGRTGLENTELRVAFFVWTPVRLVSSPTGDLFSRTNLCPVPLGSLVLWWNNDSTKGYALSSFAILYPLFYNTDNSW